MRAGIENMLGRAGGFLFKLPGREVNITDFRIDLAKGVLSFVGSCSSTHANKRTLRVDLILKDHPELLGLQTFLTSEDDARYRKFKSTILVNDMSDILTPVWILKIKNNCEVVCGSVDAALVFTTYET